MLLLCKSGPLNGPLSLDLDRITDLGKLSDEDRAISWIGHYGEGLVFLGQAAETYRDPLFLRHVPAEIRFTIGYLPATDTKKRQRAKLVEDL